MDLHFVDANGNHFVVPEAPEGYTRADDAVQIDPPPSAEHRWANGAWAIPEPQPEPVPEIVSMRQAKIQLSRAGLLVQANAAIGALEGQPGEEAQIEWASATSLRRDHPLVAGIGRALGLDDAAKDDLFRAAALIP